MASQIFHLIFFPGILLHELAHYLACVALGVRVSKVKFWGINDAYVKHEKAVAWKNVAIAVAPFLLGSGVSAALVYTGHLGVLNFFVPGPWDYAGVLFFYWLAFAFAFHSFPSDVDSKSALDSVFSFYRRKLMLRDGALEGLLWFITAPFVFLPLVVILFIISLFASVRYAGILWYVLMFIATAMSAGV